MKRINISMNNQLLATLDLLAEFNCMSRSEYIRNLINREYKEQLNYPFHISSEDIFRQMEEYI